MRVGLQFVCSLYPKIISQFNKGVLKIPVFLIGVALAVLTFQELGLRSSSPV